MVCLCVSVYIFIYMEIILVLKRRKFCHTQQHGWTEVPYAKWNNPVYRRKNTTWFPLYEVSKTARLI